MSHPKFDHPRAIPPFLLEPVSAAEMRHEIEAPFSGEFRRPYPKVEGDGWIRLLLRREKRLAGWHIGKFLDENRYYMMNSSVLPPFRRAGLYSKMTEEILEWLRKNGIERVLSRHAPDNVAILEAKKYLGFKELDRVEDSVLGPLIVMVKRL